MQISQGHGSCKAYHNNYQTYSPEGGIKTRALVEVRVNMTQNAGGNGLFLGRVGIPLTGLIPDSLLRDAVRANCPGGDKVGYTNNI